MSAISESDEAFKAEFFPDAETLFPPTVLSDEDRAFKRGSEQELIAFQRASEIVFNMAIKSTASS